MAEDQSDAEYSLQYFGFTPEYFYQDFCQTIIEEMSSVIKTSLKEVSSLSTATPATKAKLHQHVLDVHNQWCERSQAVLLEAEPTIKKFFTIPKNVLLESDALFQKTYTEAEVESLQQEVTNLETEYAKKLKQISQLEMHIATAEIYEPLVKQVDEAVSCLQPIVDTINEIKSLEKVSSVFMENRSQLLRGEDDSDSKKSQFAHTFIVED